MVLISLGIVLTLFFTLMSNVLYLFEYFFQDYFGISYKSVNASARPFSEIETPSYKECHGSLDFTCLFLLNFVQLKNRKCKASNSCGNINAFQTNDLGGKRNREDIEKMEDELHRWLGSAGIDSNVVVNQCNLQPSPIEHPSKYSIDSSFYSNFNINNSKNIICNEMEITPLLEKTDDNFEWKWNESRNLRSELKANNHINSNGVKCNKNLLKIDNVQGKKIGSEKNLNKKDGRINKKEIGGSDHTFNSIKNIDDNLLLDIKELKNIDNKEKRETSQSYDGNSKSREYEIRFDGSSLTLMDDIKHDCYNKNNVKPKLKDTQEQRRIHYREYLDICKSFGINSVVTIHGRLYIIVIGTDEFILTKDEFVNHIDMVLPEDPSVKLMFSYDDARIKLMPK